MDVIINELRLCGKSYNEIEIWLCHTQSELLTERCWWTKWNTSFFWNSSFYWRKKNHPDLHALLMILYSSDWLSYRAGCLILTTEKRDFHLWNKPRNGVDKKSEGHDFWWIYYSAIQNANIVSARFHKILNYSNFHIRKCVCYTSISFFFGFLRFLKINMSF